MTETETKETNVTKEPKEMTDAKEQKETKEPKETKEITDNKEVAEEKEIDDEKEIINEKEITEEKELSEPLAQNIEITDKLSGEKNFIDLNKIFHIDLSYNFELLKNLLTILVKNQQENENKINELYSKVLTGKFSHTGITQKPKSYYVSKIKQKTLTDTKCLQKPITPPPNEIEIDPSESFDPTVIKIIVSYNYKF